MSFRLNNVVIGGLVGRDPEVKTIDSGKRVASFSLAVDNGKDKESSWFDINAWERTAEIVESYVSKGSAVVIIGRLAQNKWTDKDGQNRTRTTIIANDIQLVGGKRKDGSSSKPAEIKDEEIPF
jgi:single-strand DNA-binding protein